MTNEKRKEIFETIEALYGSRFFLQKALVDQIITAAEYKELIYHRM
jgi:hypothetical protein